MPTLGLQYILSIVIVNLKPTQKKFIELSVQRNPFSPLSKILPLQFTPVSHQCCTLQVFHTSFTLQVLHTCQSDLQFVHCASSSRSPELYTSSYSFMTSQGFREGMFFVLNFIEQLNDKWLMHVSWEHIEIWGHKQYRND